jgi:hypothetical protein
VANVECTHEQDVLDALAADRWPDRCDAELRSHVDRCTICADLVESVGPLLAARDVVYADVPVPASGTVWWRAQMRARREATMKAARPITVVQSVAASIGLAVVVALIVTLVPSLSPLFSTMSFDTPRPTLPDVDTMKHWGWVAAIILGTWLVVTPLAIYLTAKEK